MRSISITEEIDTVEMINVVHFVYTDAFNFKFCFIFLLQLVPSKRKHFSINKDNNITHSNKYLISLNICYILKHCLVVIKKTTLGH